MCCVPYQTDPHWSANIAKCVSRTKSITSSVADTPKRSNQSTARSVGAMVSKKILQVLLGLRIGESVLFVYTIHDLYKTHFVCHLANWSEALDCSKGSIFDVHDITIVPVFFQHHVICIIFFIVFHLSSTHFEVH